MCITSSRFELYREGPVARPHLVGRLPSLLSKDNVYLTALKIATVHIFLCVFCIVIIYEFDERKRLRLPAARSPFDQILNHRGWSLKSFNHMETHERYFV